MNRPVKSAPPKNSATLIRTAKDFNLIISAHIFHIYADYVANFLEISKLFFMSIWTFFNIMIKNNKQV